MQRAQSPPPANFPFASALSFCAGKGLSPLPKVTAGQAADGLDAGQGQPVPLVAGTRQHGVSQGHGTATLRPPAAAGPRSTHASSPLALPHASSVRSGDMGKP